jgi:branched-subunit amino acid aminotransferase/4-amino-4-deoxychorismate lyase
VAAGILKTPSKACPILPGVTRNAVIAIARKKGIEVWEQDRPRLSGMLGADEVFVTNSVVGVLPVVKIGMHRIGSGKPGKITAILRETYEKNLLRP